MEPLPWLLKEVVKKKAEYLRENSLPKRTKAASSETPSMGWAPPPSRALGKGFSAPRGVTPQGTSSDAFAEVWLHYAVEYKASEAFKGELLDASAVAFI